MAIFKIQHNHLYPLVITLLFNLSLSFSQVRTNILWDKAANAPVVYATIKGNEHYAISNEEGVFELEQMNGNITIQSVVYETLETDVNFLKANDTIFMIPLTYKLDEVVLSEESLYTKMLKSVPTDYALQPHKEEFFLRAIIRKDNALYKIIDFSGRVERQQLFSTASQPMPKKNYKVQINNIRKAGLDEKDIDILMFSFKDFFTYLIRLSFSKNDFNIIYETSTEYDSRRVSLRPKHKDKAWFEGYFLVNPDNTFNEADITYFNKSLTYKNTNNAKYRTRQMNWKSNFLRNPQNNKLQLHKGKITALLELVKNNTTENYEFTYIYNSRPIANAVTVKNNINLNKDMFKLKKDYDQRYWANHEVLRLTTEMQEFINQINAMGKNSNFKTKTNMN